MSYQTKSEYYRLMRWFHEGTKGNVESRIKYNNYWKNIWNKISYESGSTMIHEKDYKPMNCCLCGKEMVSIHETHNPAPLAPHTCAKEAQEQNLPHRCCSECNATRVNPARAQRKGLTEGTIPVFEVWENPDLYPNHFEETSGKGFG